MSKNPISALRAFRLSSPSYLNDRHYLLAYGLVRGFPMERLESLNSDPYKFESLDWMLITGIAAGYGCPREEGMSPTEHDLAKKAYRDRLRADLKAWHKKLMLNWMELTIQKQKRNALKRSQVRQHPRQDTRLSKSQVA